MNFELMELPYGLNALAPNISEETLEYHYGKHHATYVKKLNSLIEGKAEFEGLSLEEIIKKSEGGIFNNAAQVYNHDFYWNGLSPFKTALSNELKYAIEKKYGSLAQFKEKFLDAAATLFGSGWTWLVVNADDGELDIEKTSNAATPITEDKTPLLVCDVWEHAYYIDYRNARPKYLEQWWEIVNWKFVSKNFADASTRKNGTAKPCNENTPECEYVDTLQGGETVAT